MGRKSIEDLMALYPTDKNTGHSYGPVYEALFAPIRDTVKSVLEVGVHQGGSLRVWRDYFPHAQVLGLDIDPKVLFAEERISTALADAADWGQLRAAVSGRTFDVVIDDGGHRVEQQVMALFYLWPFLRTGGLYVVEDVQDSRFVPHFGCFANVERHPTLEGQTYDVSLNATRVVSIQAGSR